MIPKVASLGSLAAAQGATARSLAFRNSSVSSARQESGSSSHNRRRSLDARPKSRNGSAADLLTLEAHASSGNASTGNGADNIIATSRAESPAPVPPTAPLAISRPMSPAPPAMPLWTVAESPSCTPFGSYTDELAAFGKFAPLPRATAIAGSATTTTPSPLGRPQNSRGTAVDGMGAAAVAAVEQELPPATPTASSSGVMDDLALLTGACGDLEVDTPRAAPTTAAAAAPSATIQTAPAVPPSPFTIAAVAVAAGAAKPPPLQLPLASSTSSNLAMPVAVAVPTTNATAAPVSTKKASSGASKKASAGSKEAGKVATPPGSPLALAFPPRAHEVHIYHAHANFSYVQELLGNLQHVHHMFKGAAGSGSGSAAAGAVAAARMLSRSLSRAAQRVRNACLGPLAPSPSTSTPGIRLVGGPAAAAPAKPLAGVPSAEEAASRVVLACEAMHTLTEFGWAELVTCDAEQAKLLGALDLEVHDLATGRVDAYHRQAPDHPWVHVGVSGAGTTSPQAVAALLGPASPLGPLSRANSDSSSASSSSYSYCADPSAYAAPPSTPVPAALAPSGSSSLGFAAVAMGGASMTVSRFAQQLQEAGAKVMAAAQLLQQWIEEIRAASDAAAKAAAVAVGDAVVASAASSSSSSSTPSRATPQLVTAAV